MTLDTLCSRLRKLTLGQGTSLPESGHRTRSWDRPVLGPPYRSPALVAGQRLKRTVDGGLDSIPARVCWFGKEGPDGLDQGEKPGLPNRFEACHRSGKRFGDQDVYAFPKGSRVRTV